MWLTTSYKWYGWVIPLHGLALLHLPSHFKIHLVKHGLFHYNSYEGPLYEML